MTSFFNHHLHLLHLVHCKEFPTPTVRWKSFEQEFGLCLLRNDILANNQKEIRSDKNTLFYIV